jgi:hypothetical protein
LPDINEQIPKLRYLAVYVLDLLKRTKAETRNLTLSIIHEVDSGINGRADVLRAECPAVCLSLHFAHQAISSRLRSE